MYYYKNTPYDTLEEAQEVRATALASIGLDDVTSFVLIKKVELSGDATYIHPEVLQLADLEEGCTYKCMCLFSGEAKDLSDVASITTLCTEELQKYLAAHNYINIFNVVGEESLGYYDLDDNYHEFEPVILPEFKEAVMTDEELIAAIDAALGDL